jgi:iron(III) transport system ATP-binding protein
VSFDVAKGDFFTLLGPSGCGKSTTLQCIAGLETPDEGEIEMDGEVVLCTRRKLLVPANRRNIGMIFQSYAIWPHLSVFDNVAFPLVHGQQRVRGTDVKRRVMQALEMVQLADYAERPSPHLSGGQQQRVALARALVHEPRLLLLDEPLSNLDAKLRDAMRVELRLLVKSLGITTVFVTHDQLEAMSMSDQIALMRAGKVVQLGAPRDVYLRPNSAFAADFMGRSNMIAGVLSSPATGHCRAPRFGCGELRRAALRAQRRDSRRFAGAGGDPATGDRGKPGAPGRGSGKRLRGADRSDAFPGRLRRGRGLDRRRRAARDARRLP